MLYTRKSSVVLATVVALGVCGVGQIALLPEVNQVNVVQAARNEQVTYFMAKFGNSTSWNENSVVKIPESGEPTIEVAELKINFSLLGEQTFEAILKNPADHLNVTFENVPGMTFDFSQADVEASENACGNDFYTGSLTVSNIHVQLTKDFYEIVKGRTAENAFETNLYLAIDGGVNNTTALVRFIEGKDDAPEISNPDDEKKPMLDEGTQSWFEGRVPTENVPHLVITPDPEPGEGEGDGDAELPNKPEEITPVEPIESEPEPEQEQDEEPKNELNEEPEKTQAAVEENTNNDQKLPQTGEKSAKLLVLSGLALFSMGLLLLGKIILAVKKYKTTNR